MYIYTYTHIYVCISSYRWSPFSESSTSGLCGSVYMYVYIYTCISIYMYIYMYTCISISISIGPSFIVKQSTANVEGGKPKAVIIEGLLNGSQ